jgi:iron complex transport system substrate-binding protein
MRNIRPALALALVTMTLSGLSSPVSATTVPGCVVSLSPSATETLFAIGAGSQVKAVDTDSNFPTRGLPSVKIDPFNPSVEQIAALCPISKSHPSAKPDLVVIAYDANAIAEGLRALGIKVLEQDAPSTLNDALNQIRTLGALTGHAPAANALASSIAASIAADIRSVHSLKLTHPLKALTVYYELDPTYYSVTSDTFVGSLLKSLGVTNVADAAASPSDYGYPQLSAEYLLSAKPKVVFLADTVCCAASPLTVANRTGWSTMTAVRAHQVVALNDDVASRWGPRLLRLMSQLTAAVRAAALNPQSWK